MVPNRFGKLQELPFQRIRITTPDDDFLDLDIIKNNNPRLVILCHGLEGSSDSKYIRDLAQALVAYDWDVCAMNYRSCSGEINRQLRMYNSGSTDDLHTVLQYIEVDYATLGLVGISLGGNLILKYLGEEVFPITDKLKSAAAISAPVDLDNASIQLLKKQNIPYQLNFLKTLLHKIKLKSKLFPIKLKTYPWYRTRNLYEFDNLYTAPVHGYKDALDYYTQCSSRQFLHQIRIPTLLLNAENDPFLGSKCYPIEEAKVSEFFHFQMPRYGGHVGFATNRNDQGFMVEKVVKFLSKGI